MKALSAKEGYHASSSEFTWLCAIAKNLCYDYLRTAGRTTDLSEAEELTSSEKNTEEDFIRKETSYTIHKILHELEEPYKEVFELRIFGELTFAEIANIFGKTESWARVTYHRARLKMKERMDLYGKNR